MAFKIKYSIGYNRLDLAEKIVDVLPKKGDHVWVEVDGLTKEITVGSEVGVRFKEDGHTVIQFPARYTEYSD